VTAWGVNPNRDDVLGLACKPSVSDLPEVPEAAFLLVSHERIEAAFEEAASAGVRAFVIPGLGAEAGAAGPPIVERIAARARELDAAVLGPNCMGLYVPGGPAAWIGSPQGSTAPGHVAAVCQSGSVADAFLALGGRIGLRVVVSSGREAVVDAADYVSYLASDDGTRAVSLFLETVRRPEAFAASLAECAERGKPVVCLKVGRSEAGARAALSHTGALVGSGRAFSALLRRYGAIEVDDFHELLETLEVLGRSRWPRGPRVAAVSESGGECALLADHAEAAGIPFEPLPDPLVRDLQREFPNFLTAGNPLDAWAIAEESVVYPRSLALLAESRSFDILIAQMDLSQFRDRSNDGWCELTLRALAEVTAGTGITPVVTGVHSADPPARFQELARELDVPLLRGPRDAMRALGHVVRWSAARPLGVVDELAVADVADLLAGGEGPLPEHESSLLLERCGVPFAPRLRAATPEEAAAAVAALGPPVVVKLDGPAHKARVGGIVLGVQGPEAAADAARRLGGPVLVAKQVAAGREVFCGLTRDPHYGPVLAVGAGGGDVERLDRAVVTVPPLGLDAARALVLDAGYEDASDVVARTLVALGALARAYPEIAEVDINPIVLGPDGAMAVDALVVVGSSK
jgi:acetyltransferase